MVHETYVSKSASIPLLKGEDLDKYRRALDDSLTKRFGRRSTPGKPGAWVMTRSVFPDSVVYNLYDDGVIGSGNSLFKVSYTRDEAGAFKFDGAPEAVREVFSYEPASDAANKQVVLKHESPGLWAGLPLRLGR